VYKSFRTSVVYVDHEIAQCAERFFLVVSEGQLHADRGHCFPNDLLFGPFDEFLKCFPKLEMSSKRKIFQAEFQRAVLKNALHYFGKGRLSAIIASDNNGRAWLKKERHVI
jgi:hypothetical protein